MVRRVLVALSLFLALLIASPALAQTGQINGLITDNTGAVVPGATVKAVDVATGLSRDTVTGALYPLAIQYGYGEIWFRPGLDLRRRALVAVAAFTALKLDSQVKKFGQSALNMGLSRTEVIEAVIQTAPISGFAPALNALGGLSEVLGD